MESFVFAVIAVIIMYTAAMSYLTPTSKRRVNKVTGTPVFEITTFVVVMLFVGSGGLGMMMTALGFGVGLTLINKLFVTLYGKGK